MRKAEGARTVQPGEDEAQGDIINIHKYLNRGCKENRDRLLSGQEAIGRKWSKGGSL